LIEAANTRLKGDLEESQSTLSAKDQEIYDLTNELENARIALSVALRGQADSQFDLSNKDMENSEGGSKKPPPDKQVINTAIKTTQTDINKLSERLDSEITVKGVQAAVGKAITATQATLDELAAQYDNAPMGEDMQVAIADAIVSTQASIDNLTIRLNNSYTAGGVQAAVAETIASTQAVFDELTSKLED
jgi:hypothetical protein